MIERRLLAIYLTDHLAGATGGVELARRAAASNRDTRYGEALERVRGEIEADKAALEEAMRELEVKPNRVKMAGAWAGEKVGRLKPNGRLTGYSPLSRLLELEALLMGITGKLGLWRALQRTGAARLSRIDLQDLIERAESQRETVEALRLDAASEVVRDAEGIAASAEL